MYKVHEIQAWDHYQAEMEFKELYPDMTVAHVAEKDTPELAVACTLRDHPVHGSRHWITRHYIYQCNDIKVARNDENILQETYTGLKLVDRSIESKTDAVKMAKHHTLTTRLPHSVRIVKILDNDASNVVCDVLPKGGKIGTYSIIYTAVGPKYAIFLHQKVTLASYATVGYSDNFNMVLNQEKFDFLSGQEGTVIEIQIDGSYMVEIGDRAAFYTPSMLVPIDLDDGSDD